MEREKLGSRLGFILLSAGCAIGCGNVWKFPWMCGQYGGGGFVLLYVFIAAVAAALVNPRKDALLQLNITPQERARLNALIMASTVALSSPFGYLAGWLSSMDRRLPFVFTLLLFVTAMFAIGRIQEPQVEER